MNPYRHKNGRGLKDAAAEACPVSKIDRRSVLTGKTSVWTSAVLGSTVHDSLVTGAVIRNSVIKNTTVTGGRITGSHIECELIADYADIADSKVSGASRICHTANVKNCSLANFTVYGDAMLEGWEADGKEAYISRGLWKRPPKILDLDGLTITEGITGFAFCGCYEYPIEKWLKIGNRFGKVLGLAQSQVDRIREFLLGL